VNVLLYDPLVPDPAGIITSGHENKTGRTWAIHRGEAINEEALVAVFRAIIAHIVPGAGVDHARAVIPWSRPSGRSWR
jgi:hypothetical protein